MERIIRVEFAKKFKKPRSSPTSPTSPTTKVVFESNPGRSAGYGFVSFATEEEAEAAISSLDGKVNGNKFICIKIVFELVNRVNIFL